MMAWFSVPQLNRSLFRWIGGGLIFLSGLGLRLAGEIEAPPTPEIVPARSAPWIIPAPTHYVAAPGEFTLSAATVVAGPNGPARQALLSGLNARTGFSLAEETLGRPAASTAIRLELSRPENAPADSASPSAATKPGVDESYHLVITPAGVTIRATSDAGLFYGTQSLLQIVAAQVTAPRQPVQIPAMQVDDQPRFAWRGLLLDESRHFFGKKTVEEMLDVMAYLKLNRFHWHLTDEPGWRIEIKAYPKLTTIGAIGNWSDPTAPAQFYTQADIREIVAYAEQRHILIIPEIDMPGHATAVSRAYPELSAGGTGQWAGFTFNPAREETYRFLATVLREVAALFPGPYLHIGGDEVDYGSRPWTTDPEIVAFGRAHGLADAKALEGYFVRRAVQLVKQAGKTPMGWDEVAADGVPASDITVMWWRHDKPDVLAALSRQGYPVILAPRMPCYFDFVQDDSHKYGRRLKGFNDLGRVYDFPDRLMQSVIPAGAGAGILGVEACVWTERIQNRERLEFMTLPRLAALAEDGWSAPADKDEPVFLQRLRYLLSELDRRGIHYFNPLEPAKTPEPPGAEKRVGLAKG